MTEPFGHLGRITYGNLSSPSVPYSSDTSRVRDLNSVAHPRAVSSLEGITVLRIIILIIHDRMDWTILTLVAMFLYLALSRPVVQLAISQSASQRETKACGSKKAQAAQPLHDVAGC